VKAGEFYREEHFFVIERDVAGTRPKKKGYPAWQRNGNADESPPTKQTRHAIG
jgi:hypothetical protein